MRARVCVLPSAGRAGPKAGPRRTLVRDSYDARATSSPRMVAGMKSRVNSNGTPRCTANGMATATPDVGTVTTLVMPKPLRRVSTSSRATLSISGASTMWFRKPFTFTKPPECTTPAASSRSLNSSCGVGGKRAVYMRERHAGGNEGVSSPCLVFLLGS